MAVLGKDCRISVCTGSGTGTQYPHAQLGLRACVPVPVLEYGYRYGQSMREWRVCSQSHVQRSATVITFYDNHVTP